ncbi:MAG TPA: Ig-like domain-containing protein [Gemmatimonadaceae bacterium]|nr:Ig-like domain-containing protein [Gemmatimonadaceae bacterium]
MLFTSSTIARGASALAIASGGGQTGLPGTTLPAPLVAVVSDALGHRLAGVSVQWQSSVAGVATFASPTAVTDANGEARTVVTLGTTAGTTTVTASVGALSASTTLGVSVGPAATLVAVAGSGAGIVGGTALLRARVTDATGNPVAGHAVSWAVTAGGGTLPVTSSMTNALGDAEVTWTLGFVVGAQTVTATSTGLTGSPLVFTVDAAAATGSLLRLATQPAAPTFNAPSGVVLATQPVVQLTDATGANPVYQAGVPVTVTLSDAQATLRGTTTAVTDSNGTATFSGLDVVGTAGRSTAMVFTASGYTSVTSNPLAIGPGIAATIAPLPASTSGLIGLPVDVAPSVIVRDSSGNPVSGVGVTFAAAGGTIGTGSATTDASGTASAGSWVLGAVGDNVVTATNGTLAGSPVTFHATGTAGAVAGMKFISSPANALTGAPLSTVLVALVDAVGNVVTTATDVITLVVGGGRTVTLQGTTTQAAVSGVATFADLAIATAGSAYQLEATSGQLAPALSAAFDVTAPVQVGSVRLVSGAKQLLPIKGSLPPDSVAFVVHDANDAPMAGIQVSFQLNEFPTCSIATGVATTDANGVVARAVSAGDAIGACEVTAIAGDTRATSKIAVYPTTATHVWFGGTIEVDHSYDVPSNWLDVRDGKESLPMPSDAAYVPYWQTNLGPQLQQDAQLAALMVQQYAAVDLNGYTLTTTGSISAATASVTNGRVVAGGGTGTRVTGQFDRLDVGRIDYCGGDAATLDTLSTKELRVICRATVGTYATTDTLDASGNGELSISANATLVTNGGASLTGGKVTTAGTLYVGSDAVITPSSLDVVSGGQLHVAGRATLGRVQANVSFAAGSILQIDGDATFDGGGSVAADAVMLSGNAFFTGAGSWSFPSGELFLYADLDVRSGQGAVLSTSGSHLTHFAGSKAQTISVAPGAASFAQASVENRQDVVSFKGPVAFTSDKLSLDLASGAKVEMSNGPVDVMSSVQVGNTASLTLFTDMSLRTGELRLFDNSTFTVQEGFKFTGVCTTTVNAVISTNVSIGGFGTINGLPASLSACTK